MAKGKQSSLFNRYIWLVDTIYSAGKISFEDISRKWENSSWNDDHEPLPKKTFRRHINEIEEFFQIEIECDRKDDYKYYIAYADDIEKGGVRTWLINTFAVNNFINESHQLKRRILFEDIPSGQRYLTPIIEAMRDGVKLEMTYQSFKSSEPSTFDVEPWCLKVFKKRWYMLGKSDRYDEPRVYALDRIRSLSATDKEFKLPKHFEAKDWFTSAYGIIVDMEYDIYRIRFKVSGSQRDYFRTLPLHHSQKEVETRDDYSIFEVYLRPSDDWMMEMLSYGPSVEILSPEWLRPAMLERAKNMVKLYKNQ